jgi:hypothetical protein
MSANQPTASFSTNLAIFELGCPTAFGVEIHIKDSAYSLLFDHTHDYIILLYLNKLVVLGFPRSEIFEKNMDAKK